MAYGGSPESMVNMNLLIAVGCVTEDDMVRFRDSLDPGHLDIFEDMTDYRKLIITALSQMPQERLRALARGEEQMYMIGIHDIRQHLQFLIGAKPELFKENKK